MLTQTLTTALEQLRLTEAPLKEGTVSVLAYDFSPALKTHFKQVIGFAYRKWGHLPFDKLPNLAAGLNILNIRLGQYFQDPNANTLPTLTPNNLKAQLSHFLMMIVMKFTNDEALLQTVYKDASQTLCLSSLCLLHTYFCHEHISDSCLEGNEYSLLEIQKSIILARIAFKRVDSYPVIYPSAELEKELAAFKRTLLNRIYILESLYIPNALGFKELQYHIDRKNQLAKLKQSHYHAELIFNQNAYQQHDIDQTVVKTLIDKIKLIKNKQQPRTQFIVDILGIGHAMVVDVDFNEHTDTLEIICVEPACLGFQADFLTQLLNGLSKQQMSKTNVIAIQTGLLKDYHSCYILSFALSSEMAKKSFQELSKHQKIIQPTFLRGFENTRQPELDNVSWYDVTALGKKVVMMAQSFTEMKDNLLKLFPKQNTKADTIINDFKHSYGLGKKFLPLTANETKEESYSHIKRHALRQKTTQSPFSDLTVSKVLEKMKSETPAQALRRLAAGFGASRDMQFLLKAHPEIINECSETTGRTALHFAYANNKLGRAYHLAQAGADVTIEDSHQQKPRELLKF